MRKQEFKLRRDELMKQLGTENAGLIYAASEHVRSGRQNYPYRQNSNFYYLTDFNEPDALAVFIPGRAQGEFVLFCHEHDDLKQVWLGARHGRANALEHFGADQAFLIEEADAILPALLSGRNLVCETALENIVHQMRLKKNQYEIGLIRKAIDITAAGFIRAMQQCRPGMYEFELEAEILYEFMRLGSRYEAFKTIVGGGANACILHYEKNTDILKNNDLVLIDSGAEYQYYCSDVSRTFPINGKFLAKQAVLYEAVLEAQLAVIDNIYPGIRFTDLQIIAENSITNNLLKLGLIKSIETGCKDFFMHKISHSLGLDTHDVGSCDVLEPGMVITVEPGIYIKEQGVGIRIEDDILVTANGHEVLTSMIPKSIRDIEKLM